jgi:hypothetical protein
MGGDDQEAGVVPVRRVPRRPQLVLQPDGQVQEAAGKPKQNPYIDAAGYKQFVAEMKTTREKLVKEQTAAGPPAPRGSGPPRN